VPSPIGHALAGAAIAWSFRAVSPPKWPTGTFTSWKLPVACAVFAALPDVDLLYMPTHRTATHSVPVAILFTIVAAGVTGWVKPIREWCRTTFGESPAGFFGLACGLALALLIITYVRSELGYDRFHEKADRLYRFSYAAPNGMHLAATPPPIAPLLKEYFPGVEEAGRIYVRNVSITRPDNEEAFEETDIMFADSSIARMFTFEFVKGNPKHPLRDKFTLIINEEMAQKYFGNEDPIGNSLTFGGRNQFKVIGVVKNFPENSHIRFNMLVPYDNMYDLETARTAQILKENLAINFVISHSYTYVMMKPGADPKEVDNGMDAFLKKYARPQLQVGQVFTLMPVLNIHLDSTLLVEPSATNSWSNLYIFIGVGILTLIIACINYINLSTAQSLTRIKEIGIRKILGSMRYQLIFQFLAL
jgi:putative ABC transport system permease protein